MLQGEPLISISAMPSWHFGNAPKRVEHHEEAAVDAAYRCQKVVAALGKEGLPFSTRIGIHTAQVFVGNFGARDRMNYTLAGDGVNLASRLEGQTDSMEPVFLVSGYTVSKLQRGWLLRHVDTVSVKGKTSRPRFTRSWRMLMRLRHSWWTLFKSTSVG